MFAGGLAALLIRIFGNIAQMIFDQSKKLEEIKERLTQLDHSSSDSLDHISCDSKDISQNTHRISGFFEQIQKHLGLNK